MLLALLPLALAESADTLSQGASVVYAGLGSSTFQYGSSGELRDRQARARLDTYAALGLGRRLQLAVDAPLVRTGILIDHEDRPPCREDRADDWCAPVTTLGESGLHGRLRLGGGDTRGAVDVGLRSDRWNAWQRARWTNAGQGATTLVASGVFGQKLGRADLVAYGRYGFVIGQPVELSTGLTERLPYDWVAGGLQLGLPTGALWSQASVTGFSRLGGEDFGSSWTETYPSAWIWSGLAYRELRGELKTSIPLGDSSGLHLSLGRVLVAANGPRDAWDASVGVHRYWGGS
jgi:hypothetical protein